MARLSICPLVQSVRVRFESVTFLLLINSAVSRVDVPYQPMFDMPDYKILGREIATLAHSYHFDDAPYLDPGFDPLFTEPESYHLPLPQLGA